MMVLWDKVKEEAEWVPSTRQLSAGRNTGAFSRCKFDYSSSLIPCSRKGNKPSPNQKQKQTTPAARWLLCTTAKLSSTSSMATPVCYSLFSFLGSTALISCTLHYMLITRCYIVPCVFCDWDVSQATSSHQSKTSSCIWALFRIFDLEILFRWLII